MKPDMYDINYNNPYHVNRHNLGDQYQANLKLTRMFSDFGFKVLNLQQMFFEIMEIHFFLQPQ